ncbi:N-acetyltransferase family protein [Fundicoccus sp. Sow4_H7]|uniref:GNAT family N-acetyltransferase n=1 Tax=Fundicoccus sp. Sow4_H7 TaxID=3438784 RepID=UPI003F8DA123
MAHSSDQFQEIEVDVIIRQASQNDAKAILALYREIGRETEFLTFDEKGIEISVEKEVELIRRFEVAPTSIMLVAEVDDQLVGIANLAAFDAYKQSHVAELGVSIVKEYWGYGIGSILMEAMIDFAEEVDLKVITLEVVVENKRAISLYKKFDFEIVGELNKRLKVDYRYYNSYIMERLI